MTENRMTQDWPASGNPELDSLAAALFDVPGGPVRVQWLPSAAATPPPAGWRQAERYAVVPDLRRARFLVPAARRAAAASLLRYNRLRSPRTAASRAVVGAAFGVGAGPVFRQGVRIVVEENLPADAQEQVILTAHLSTVLGTSPLAAGIGVRPLDPNSKPTLQLFRGAAPAGYAKVGWNDATRALVDTEARTLAGLPPLPTMDVPALLHSGSWNGRVLAVAAPLPVGVTRHRDENTPPSAGVLAPLVAVEGVRAALADSPYLLRARRELRSMQQAGDAPDLAAALSAYLDAVERACGPVPLRFGRWHGDWVPWNVGWAGGRLQVWDWEHSTPDAPAGLDLAHWPFQVELVLRGRPLTDALAAVRLACAAGWHELGVSAQDGETVADLYLVELALRTYRLFRGGGGWNGALYPALLPALAAWTALRA